MDSILDMVRRNQAVGFGSGDSRSNPIADRDLAKLCVNAVTDDRCMDIPVGGPETFSRREILQTAFEALGKPERIRHMPAWVPRVIGPVIGAFAPRMGDMMAFVHTISTNDFVAPALGTMRLGDYFRQRAVG